MPLKSDVSISGTTQAESCNAAVPISAVLRADPLRTRTEEADDLLPIQARPPGQHRKKPRPIVDARRGQCRPHGVVAGRANSELEWWDAKT